MPTEIATAKTPLVQPTRKETAALLHPVLLGPWPLLGAWFLPVAVQAGLLGSALHFASGGLQGPQANWALACLAGVAANLLASLCLAAWLYARKRVLSPLMAFAALALQVANIALATVGLENWHPSELQAWMLSADRLLLHQWTLLAIPTFYFALVVSGQSTTGTSNQRSGKTALAVVGAPVALYLVVALIMAFGSEADVSAALVVVAFVSSALLLSIALLRALLANGRKAFARASAAPRKTTLLLALALPLSGLLLNASIPFPVDFQHPATYCLLLANAGALLLPGNRSRRWNLAAWIAGCLTLPFTLYFFIVFLPLIPFSLLALPLLGLGLLILAPTALLVHHAQRLWHLYQQGDYHPGAFWSTGLAAAATLPCLLVLETNFMRAELHRGMDYVLTPDTEQAQRYQGFPFLAQRSLEWLNELKQERHYPFITPLRSHLLFDGMTLTDAKIEQIYAAYTSKTLPVLHSDSFNLFSQESPRIRRFRDRNPPPLPPAHLLDATTETRRHPESGLPVTRLALSMRGGPEGQSEFKATLRLPEGSWVSGFALYIEDDRVEGRLFEKESALWVYRMIRDFERAPVLKDPATLTLNPDGTLDLQVFPFNPEQIRKAEIDFTSLHGGTGSLRNLDHQREYPLAAALGATAAERIHRFNTSDGFSAAIGAQFDRSQFATRRTPYVHLFVDRSATGIEADVIRQRMAALQQGHPLAETVQVTLVNLEAVPLFAEPLPWSDALRGISETQLDQALPRKRGLLLTPALQRAALQSTRSPRAATNYPIWATLSASAAFDNAAFEAFRSLNPESPPVRHLNARSLRSISAPDSGKKVVLARAGGQILAREAKQDTLWLRFYDAVPDTPLELYHPATDSWVPAPIATRSDSQGYLNRVAETDARSARAAFNPSYAERQRPEIVSLSKRHNVLTSQTAFTVVENELQWAALEDREVKTLSAHGSLQFDETPEPSFWILAIALALFLIRQRRARSPSLPQLISQSRPSH